LTQSSEIEFQRIALMQREVLMAGELALQDGDQVEIQLQYIEVRPAAQQAFGECALARADLDKLLARLGVTGPQDPSDHTGIVKKVLTETLARAVLVVGHRKLQSSLKLEA